MRIVLASVVLAAPLALIPVAQGQVREGPYAHVAIQSGDFALAERRLLAEQKVFPAKPEILLNLAALYTKTGRHAEARAIYNRVLTLDPVAMNVTSGEVAPSHLIAGRGLSILDAKRQASR